MADKIADADIVYKSWILDRDEHQLVIRRLRLRIESAQKETDKLTGELTQQIAKREEAIKALSERIEKYENRLELNNV